MLRNLLKRMFRLAVAIDEDHVPVRIPAAVPQTEAELVLYQGGVERRSRRLAQRVDLMNLLRHSQSEASP